MIATISKQGGRRYPQMRGALQRALWLPSVGTTVAPPVIGATTADRTTAIAFESRRTIIAAESRATVIPPEVRRLTVVR